MKKQYIFMVIGFILGAVSMFAAIQLLSSSAEEKSHLHQQETGLHTEENESHNDDFHNEDAHDDSDGHTSDEHNPNGQELHKEIVQLSDSELEEIGIVLDTVKSGVIGVYTELTGEIVPDPDRIAHIKPRFDGVVMDVYKKTGDRVKQGEVIAVIESNESLVTYEVTSSISGVILDMHMTPGEVIIDNNHIVTVADLSSVWAELQIYQKDITKIKKWQKVQISLGENEDAVTGSIFYISPIVDEHTRTATARVRLSNAYGYWKPGMFVTAKVVTGEKKKDLVVHNSALQNFEGKKVVFVRNDEGFSPLGVTVGLMNTEYAEITSGLEAGQTYVAEGAFILKAELLKESFGGGHNH